MSRLSTELLALSVFEERLNSAADPQILIVEACRTFDCIDSIRALVIAELAPVEATEEGE